MTTLNREELRKKIKTTWINIRFPFFAPRDHKTDKIVWEKISKQSYWWSIPDGWRIAFGIRFAKDFKRAIRHSKKPLFFVNIKEKFGILDLTLNAYTDEIFKLISKYVKLSSTTCIKCGKKADGKTYPWIFPLCYDCYADPKNNYVARKLSFKTFEFEKLSDEAKREYLLEAQNDEYNYGHNVPHKYTNDEGEDI